MPSFQRGDDEQRPNPMMSQPAIRRRKGKGQGGAFGGRGQVPARAPREPRPVRPPNNAGHIMERSLAGTQVSHRRNFIIMMIALLATLPGLYLRFVVGGHHGGLEPVAAAATFGLAVVGASFILSWAAEAAEMDIS